MKYSIDKIEKEIVIIENIDTGEKKEVNINLLPIDIKEGTIIIFDNDSYVVDKKEQKARMDNIMSRFQRLKK